MTSPRLRKVSFWPSALRTVSNFSLTTFTSIREFRLTTTDRLDRVCGQIGVRGKNSAGRPETGPPAAKGLTGGTLGGLHDQPVTRIGGDGSAIQTASRSVE